VIIMITPWEQEMSDSDPAQEDIASIEEETALDQRVVPCMGDDLIAAMTASE
jgi:hypothetical protein